MNIEVRPMRREDLRRVGELSEQLGYPIEEHLLQVRFSHLVDDPGQALLVAEALGRVVGWIHLHLQVLLESEPYVEIGGVVVDRTARRLGAGRALIRTAQRWASERHLERIRVRSNVTREEAHRFYPALGFIWLKTQHNYELRCAGEA